MARSSFQKLKLLHVRNYLLQNSDEEHPITVNQMIQYLESNGIAAERKSIYDDIEALRTFGMDIEECKRGRVFGYYVASRTFELPELKLLVDSVQSFKFITYKKTASLIKKIETLASVHSAQLLHRQVFVKNRIKTMNESIYYNVDEIHNGISNNRKIRFLYFEYNVAKERQYRHGGAYYVVSPFAMTWDDENYYMVAYDSEAGIIKHYRVDKMEKISTLDEERDGQEVYQALDMAVYTRKVFGMFTGDETKVQMRFENHLVCRSGPVGQRGIHRPRRPGPFHRPDGRGGQPPVFRMDAGLWPSGADRRPRSCCGRHEGAYRLRCGALRPAGINTESNSDQAALTITVRAVFSTQSGYWDR